MTAQEAKAKLLAVIKELQGAGFSIGGHWDDDIVVLISKEELFGTEDQFDPANYAEISYDDLIGL